MVIGHEVEPHADDAELAQPSNFAVCNVGSNDSDALKPGGGFRDGIEHGGVVDCIAARLYQQDMAYAVAIEQGFEGFPPTRLVRLRRVSDAAHKGKSLGIDDVSVAVDGRLAFHRSFRNRLAGLLIEEVNGVRVKRDRHLTASTQRDVPAKPRNQFLIRRLGGDHQQRLGA